jgi:molecular chaperone DnaK
MTNPQARASRSVGIDLGTTYSAVAYLNDKLIPMVAPVGDGSPVMPSAVFFDDEDVVVGQFALQQSKAMADRLVQFIKEQIGQRWRATFQGIEHTPETISAIILGELLKRAATRIGPTESAVITVPACFTERQRKSTQQAGELAKLKVLGTLNEPMAAALMFGRLFQLDAEKDPSLRKDGPQHIAVYDLGGGTFDVTIIRVTPESMQELTTNGDRKLGGKDWDQCLFDYIADQWRKTDGVDVGADPQARQDLILACERAKRELGEQSHSQVRVTVGEKDRVIDVSRDTFEGLTSHLVQSTRLTLEQALQDAGLTWQTLNRVVLVGGSTFLPAVRRMLEEAHGVKPDTRVHPMTAVAQGAALYAHLLETGAAHRDLIQLVGHDSTPPEPATSPVVVVSTPAPVKAQPAPEAASPPAAVATQSTSVPAPAVAAEAHPQIRQPEPVLPPVPRPCDKAIPVPKPVPNTEPKPPAVAAPQVTFVTASGFGVAVTYGGASKNTVLIPRNTTVPDR